MAVEDARDFSLSGCHEVIVTGKAQMGSVEGFINVPKVLRVALGLEPALDPGADLAKIGDFDALWDAFVAAMEQVAVVAHEASLARDRYEAERHGGRHLRLARRERLHRETARIYAGRRPLQLLQTGT